MRTLHHALLWVCTTSAILDAHMRGVHLRARRGRLPAPHVYTQLLSHSRHFFLIDREHLLSIWHWIFGLHTSYLPHTLFLVSLFAGHVCAVFGRKVSIECHGEGPRTRLSTIFSTMELSHNCYCIRAHTTLFLDAGVEKCVEKHCNMNRLPEKNVLRPMAIWKCLSHIFRNELTHHCKGCRSRISTFSNWRLQIASRLRA